MTSDEPGASPPVDPDGITEASVNVRPASEQTDPLTKIAPFRSLDSIAFDPASWQAENLLRKTGVSLMVVPPGACSFALCGFFAGYLAGKLAAPFGTVARYPGDVLLCTHTPHLDKSWRASLNLSAPSTTSVLTRQTQRRFNWRAPMIALHDVLAGRQPGSLAAVIIDTGAFPQRVDEAIVETAYLDLNRMAEDAKCLVMIVVESTSRNADPYERVPRSLRILRGTLLAVPMRSKALAAEPSAPPEFLLMRLVDVASSALTVRFSLRPVWDDSVRHFAEGSRISWSKIEYDDPREAFRRAETADLSTAERVAVAFAAEVIGARGPMSSSDLQAAGKLRGIAPTTMRDALSVAKVLGHLIKFRNDDQRWLWALPGFQFPGWARTF